MSTAVTLVKLMFTNIEEPRIAARTLVPATAKVHVDARAAAYVISPQLSLSGLIPASPVARIIANCLTSVTNPRGHC